MSILILLGFCIYSQVLGRTQDRADQAVLLGCLDDPASCRDRSLVVRGRVAETAGDTMIIQPNLDSAVKSPLKLDSAAQYTVHIGDIVTVLAVFEGRTVARLAKLQKADWRVRVFKYLISSLGLGLWLLLFLQRYRFSWRDGAVFNLETAVVSTHLMQPIDSHDKTGEDIITNKVTAISPDTPDKSIDCAIHAPPTDVSRFKNRKEGGSA